MTTTTTTITPQEALAATRLDDNRLASLAAERGYVVKTEVAGGRFRPGVGGTLSICHGSDIVWKQQYAGNPTMLPDSTGRLQRVYLNSPQHNAVLAAIEFLTQ